MKKLCASLLLALTACSPALPSATPRVAPSNFLPQNRASVPATPIEHVVIVVQENRTVDNLFHGFKGTDYASYGYMSNGQRVALQQVGLNSSDIDNSYRDSLNSYDGGKMDGFDQNPSGGTTAGRYAYSYVDRAEVQPYWDIATQFTLADRMFPTTHGQSWSSHIDLISGTTNLTPGKAMVDFPSSAPWDCSAPPGTTTPTVNSSGYYNLYGGPYPCFTQFRTMADTLDAARLSWRYYAPSINGDWPSAWSAFGEIENVRNGPDWKNIVTPPPQFLTDVAHGKLANVTWVTPDWTYSDHAGSGGSLGPSWVAAITNAIGKSPFWKSTVVVVVWDDFGGWFDHVPPKQLDFHGLGIRVPCLVISPYSTHGTVVHAQYEFGSVLRMVEDVFNLPRLGTAAAGYSDARATSLLTALNFKQAPAAFKPISAPVFPYVFLHMRPSGVAPDN